MKTFSICNLGCKVNNYEANWYRQELEKEYTEVPFGNEKADIFIINSCTVTNTAGAKSRQMMHKARKLNPQAVIAVVGCYAQMEYQNEGIFDDCDILIGSNHKKELPELIRKHLQTGERIVRVEEFRNAEFEEMAICRFNQTRAYLKIQDGCNQFCSYCVIPFARGNPRCLQPDKAVQIASDLVKSGHKEIVLTGIHTGRYYSENTDLTALIKRLLNEVDGLERIRISSIEMTEVTDELIELIASDSRVARHLHIPLQAGSDRVLKAMNRPYTTAEYLARINQIRAVLPNVSISADVIVGFPQETDEEYQITEDFIREAELSFLHVFPYAAKKHTVAAGMKGQIPETIKKQRVAKLTKLSADLYNTFVSRFVGGTGNVIFERERDGVLLGHNSEYIEVHVQGDSQYLHQNCTVRYTGFEGDHLLGELV